MISRDSSATHKSQRVFDDISMSSSSSSQRFFVLLSAFYAPTRRTPMRASSRRSQPSSQKRFFIVFLPVLFEASDDDDERGWKLFCAFLGGRMKANEERENCGVFHVKDTHMYTYIFHLRKRYTRLYSATIYAAKTHTETTEVLLSPDQSDAQTKPLSLFVSLFLCLFLCFFVCVFAGRASRRTSQLSGGGGGGGVPVRVGVAKLFVPTRTPVFVQIL